MTKILYLSDVPLALLTTTIRLYIFSNSYVHLGFVILAMPVTLQEFPKTAELDLGLFSATTFLNSMEFISE